ncbi:hypothetical protein PhCBS80983_g05676 [Powellomyces hirtus]|uniref:Uncharacterized protein n=1 Tax=Powellomyces hirtus TaxID=109895 RepID=A0A507DT69_9FUNG|nr:hypothetical protein PhCBS80983_g05676 [Powellomyces hirtus]
MSHYDSSVPKLVAENPRALKYRRRVLSARRLEPSARVHTYKVLGRLGAVAAVGFMVLSADWGDGEHCFSGIRRWAAEQRRDWFELTPEDERGEDPCGCNFVSCFLGRWSDTALCCMNLLELRATGTMIPPKEREKIPFHEAGKGGADGTASTFFKSRT